MEGDPEFEASQDVPEFPYARVRRAAGPRGHPRRATREWGRRGIGRARCRPAGGDRRAHRPGRAASCLRTSRSSRRRSSPSRCSRGIRTAEHGAPTVGDWDPVGGRAEPEWIPTHGHRGLEARRTRSRPSAPSPTARCVGRHHARSGRGPGRRGERTGLLLHGPAPAADRAGTRTCGDWGGAPADVPAAWQAMVRRCATWAGPGSASMAISAVDNALWDLKARLLGRAASRLLGRVPRGGAGLRQRRLHLLYAGELGEQLAGWVEQGWARSR